MANEVDESLAECPKTENGRTDVLGRIILGYPELGARDSWDGAIHQLAALGIVVPFRCSITSECHIDVWRQTE